MIQTRIYVDGRISDEASAVVPVLDRGFLYGDSIYEVTRTAGGRPVDLGPHLDRLGRSAAGLRMMLPPRPVIEDAVAETLAAAGVRAGGKGDAYIRIVITRGGGDIGLDPMLADRPRVVVIVRAVSLPKPESVRDGVSVRLVGVERMSPRALDPAIKSGNYLNNILALDEARQKMAYEAVMCDAQGRVTEGSSSNIWCVSAGVVRTPPTTVGLLPGITRWRLLALAAANGLLAEEVELRPADLLAADELFLTSSIRGVLPVSQIDERTVPVGPVTRRLLGLYDRFLADVAAGRA